MADLRNQNGAAPPVATDSAATPQISVVVPVYNELENLAVLHESLVFALDAIGRSYEILIVDDGSSDGSRTVLREMAAQDPNLRAILLRRNYGQTTAMAAGFDHARAPVMVTMDGDLQNDPADIARLLERLEQGYDIVCGWRRDRKDRWLTRLLPSRLANMLISWTTGVPIHDTGCSLKVYRSWVVKSLDLYSDMHRFVAALAAGVGARVAEVPVRHHARQHGQSKYGLARTFRVLADLLVIKMLIQFSAHPIRWFSLLSLPLVLLCPILFVAGFVRFNDWEIVGLDFHTANVTAGVVVLLVALNVVLLGFLAELQLKVSRFFRRRVWVAAKEASQ